MSQIYFGNLAVVTANDVVISLDIVVSLADTNLSINYNTPSIIVDYNTINIEVDA